MRYLPRRQLLIFAFYLVIAMVITYPAVLSLHTQFLGGDTGDSYEMARHIWWFKTALQTGQSPFWQSNLGYPDGFSGVSLQADFLQFFPMWLLAFFMPLASAFNITVLLTMALNGWAMSWLMAYLLKENPLPTSPEFRGGEMPPGEQTGATHVSPRQGNSEQNNGLKPIVPTLSALLAGVVFMAAPTFQGHLFEGHTGLMVQGAVPLYIYALFRLVEAPRLEWRWLALAVIFFQAVPSGHMLQVIYMLLPLTGLFWLARVWQRDWAGAWRIILMGGISSILLLVFLMPLIQETLASEAYTDTGGYVRYSADLLAIVTPSFYHPLFGKLPYTAQVLGVNLGEGSMYLGIVAAALAGLGVVKFRAARWWLLLAVFVWILSLGPLLKIFDKPVVLTIGEYQTYITLPFAFVQNLPGFSLARTPARFNFALALALAVMAGYGAAWVWGQYLKRDAGNMDAGATQTRVQHAAPLRVQYIVFGVLAAVILYEYQSFWSRPPFSDIAIPSFPTRPAVIPEAVYALRDRNDVRAVFDIPYEHLLGAKEALYFQTAHEKPLIAGQVTRQTPVNPAKLAIMQYTLDPALLKSRGADVVIFHKKRAQEINQLDTLRFLLGARFAVPIYEDNDIAIYQTPGVTGTPAFMTYLPPVTRLMTTADFYFYTSQSAWVNFSAQLTADGRNVVVYFNDVPLHRWTIQGTDVVNVPLPARIDEFGTVRLVVEPPCPQQHPETLTCRSVRLEAVKVNALPEGVIYNLIQYGRGAELAASSVPEPVNGSLSVHLWWRFSEPRHDTDVRFVHVLDSSGMRVVQDDTGFGSLPAGSEWTETVTLDVSSLPPGEYSVRTGWYDFNTMQRFEVQTTNLMGGQDAAPEIDKFTMR